MTYLLVKVDGVPHISWNILRPDSASVTLSTYDLENVDHRVSGRTIVQDRIAVGSGVRL
jgi:hypothetical protein